MSRILSVKHGNPTKGYGMSLQASMAFGPEFGNVDASQPSGINLWPHSAVSTDWGSSLWVPL